MNVLYHKSEELFIIEHNNSEYRVLKTNLKDRSEYEIYKVGRDSMQKIVDPVLSREIVSQLDRGDMPSTMDTDKPAPKRRGRKPKKMLESVGV
jgi:hypothetical protein